MAISPDEHFLYFIMQNPLANPDVKAYQQAKNTRLFKIERASMKVVGEYVYTLDDPTTFRRDPSKRQNDPRISELMAIGLDRLVVLERTEQTTKLYEIELGGATNIVGTRWDDAATSPSLEQTAVAACEDHAGAEDVAARHRQLPRHRRQDRRHGAARRRLARHHQRRRLRHRRRPHADRGVARDRHRAPLSQNPV